MNVIWARKIHNWARKIFMSNCRIRPLISIWSKTGFVIVATISCRFVQECDFRLSSEERLKAHSRSLLDFGFVAISTLLVSGLILVFVFREYATLKYKYILSVSPVSKYFAESVFVYTMKTKDLDSSEKGKNFCHENLHRVAFVTATMFWVVFGAGVAAFLVTMFLRRKVKK